jgi:excisionase family DNA binding protein
MGIFTVYENRIALSVREAAEATGYNESRLRQFISAGTLKAYRPGGKGDLRIFREDLLEWVSRGAPTIRPGSFRRHRANTSAA